MRAKVMMKENVTNDAMINLNPLDWDLKRQNGYRMMYTMKYIC